MDVSEVTLWVLQSFACGNRSSTVLVSPAAFSPVKYCLNYRCVRIIFLEIQVRSCIRTRPCIWHMMVSIVNAMHWLHATTIVRASSNPLHVCARQRIEKEGLVVRSDPVGCWNLEKKIGKSTNQSLYRLLVI